MKPSKLHKILIYIRKPLCFVVVLSIVAIYLCSYSAYAFTGTMDDNYEIPSDIYQISIAKQVFDLSGGESSNLNVGSYCNFYNGFYPNYTDESFANLNAILDDVKESLPISSVVLSSVTYNVEGRELFITYNNGYLYFYYIGATNGTKKCALINCYPACDSQCEFLQFKVSYSALSQNHNIQNSIVEGKKDNLYVNSDSGIASRNYYFNDGLANMIYCTCPIYNSTSDSSSGFSKYNGSSTSDFSFVNSDNYFDFNVYSNALPEPEPDIPSGFTPQGQYYNYGYITGKIYPVSSASYVTELNFSYNEYMRTHPEEFELWCRSYCTLYKGNGQTPSFTYRKEVPLTHFASDTNSGYDANNSAYSFLVTFDDLMDTGGNTVSDALKGIYVDAGGSAGMYDTDSIVTWNHITLTGEYQNFGKWTIKNRFLSQLEKIVINETFYFVWVGGEPETASGTYNLRYESDTAETTVTGNDIVNNYNPPSTNDPQYPQEITGGNGQVIVGGTTINPTFQSNINAAVQYLFNLDATDLNLIAGNTHDSVQYVINTLSDQSENGFWGVLTRTYSMIPEQIWDWIKLAVAAICGGAVIGWVFRVGRVKNS